MKVGPEPLVLAIRNSSLATLAGLLPHYVLFYSLLTPLLTDALSELIMAHTPSQFAVPILNAFGDWAKPWAQTGALAILGLGLFIIRLSGALVVRRRVWIIVIFGFAVAYGLTIAAQYHSLDGALAFWAPALLVTILLEPRLNADQPVIDSIDSNRRDLLAGAARYGLPLAMTSGTIGVAIESYIRNQALARSAAEPVNLFRFSPPLDRQRFASDLVRKPVTPVAEFYGMSKNTVDPNVDVRQWRLRITFEGRPVRTCTYTELLSLPRQTRYQTLRCISNTLHSDLMGTAAWAGVHLSQLVDRRMIPSEAVEVAFIGVEGHDDSLSLDYAFGPEALLALGMNGKTLSRTHGFPIRLLAPRYYGCRNVKWIGEIRFVTKPYYGTWQRMGYTKEPVIHIASHIDHQQRDGARVRCGGVSFAGDRGIRAVRVRVNGGPWSPATIESALSDFTWTRWCVEMPAKPGDTLEANAQDGFGAWQELTEASPFPNGLAGPTTAKVTV